MKDLSNIERMTPEEVMKYIREATKEIEQKYIKAKRSTASRNVIRRRCLNNIRRTAVSNSNAIGRFSKVISLVINKKAFAAAKACGGNFTFSISAILDR